MRPSIIRVPNLESQLQSLSHLLCIEVLLTCYGTKSRGSPLHTPKYDNPQLGLLKNGPKFVSETAQAALALRQVQRGVGTCDRLHLRLPHFSLQFSPLCCPSGFTPNAPKQRKSGPSCYCTWPPLLRDRLQRRRRGPPHSGAWADRHLQIHLGTRTYDAPGTLYDGDHVRLMVESRLCRRQSYVDPTDQDNDCPPCLCNGEGGPPQAREEH